MGNMKQFAIHFATNENTETLKFCWMPFNQQHKKDRYNWEKYEMQIRLFLSFQNTSSNIINDRCYEAKYFSTYGCYW